MIFAKILPAVATAAALALPGIAAAATFTGSWSVSANTADPGLVVAAWPGAGSGSLDLDVGESATFDLFHIWTDEADVGYDDLAPKPIAVDFSFADPTAWGAPVAGSIGGSTSGDKSLFGLIQKGKLTWDGPLTLAFGQGGTGKLTFALSDAIFNTGLFGLKEGWKHGATVQATVSYDVAPVPLPAALPLLLGALGLMGVAARRRGPAAAA